MKKLKLYIETSAWNFVFAEDSPEKMAMTQAFFDLVSKGVYDIFISEVVTAEIRRASVDISDRLLKLVDQYDPQVIAVDDDMTRLAELYLRRKIIPPKKIEDGLHVAVASVKELDAGVTWNFQHLANLRKSELFYAVNLEMGYYKKVEIITPMEVMAT